MLVTYFLIMGGVIYDAINEPPSIGQTVDRRGVVHPETIMKGRQGGQYVIEGLCASMFFVLAGTGFIMIEKSSNMTEADGKKPVYAIAGAIISTVAILMTYVFVQIKFSF